MSLVWERTWAGMEVLPSGGSGASWTCPAVDVLNETQVYRFAGQHGTLGNFLTSATDGWHVAIIRMASSFGATWSSLGLWVPSMDTSVPYPLALLCGQTCKRAESTSALKRMGCRAWETMVPIPLLPLNGGSSCTWYWSCLSLGFCL